MRGHFILQWLIFAIVIVVFALAATGCKDARQPAYAENNVITLTAAWDV